MRLFLSFCAVAIIGLAQYPGQYPPGQYPPGQYPPGRGRYPNPNDPRNDPNNNPRNNPPGRGRNSKDSKANTKLPIVTSGMFRAAGGSQFALEADDHRIITYRTNGQTVIRKDAKDADLASFQPGDRLTVESTEDDDSYYTATSVKFDKPGTPADRAVASQTWDLPRLGRAPAASSSSSGARREPGDDRPVLRRSSDSNAPAASPTASNDSSDDRPVLKRKDDAAPKESTKAAAAKAEAAKPEEDPIDTRPTTTMKPADPPREDDDTGPPSLRHGPPVPRRAPARVATSSGESTIGPTIKPREADPAPTPSAAAVEISPSAGTTTGSVQFVEDPLIRKAREVADAYAGSLPNFFCQQITTRYQSENPKAGWQAVDTVTADITYEDGKESYKNIKVAGKAVKADMNDIEGSRSTGEFQTILADLLSPFTAAVFRRAGSDTIRGRAAQIFRYDVPRERSHWRIEAPAQLYYPAHSGSLWIDKETGRVLRIEQQSRSMPTLFPFDTTETAIDYDSVRLSATQPYILPVSSEVLTCVRGTSMCMRNKIEFRNYRKFGAESNITFDGKPQ